MQKHKLQIAVNGEGRAVAGPCSLAKLLDQLELGQRHVAVAVNRDVVPRSEFDEQQLQDGDRIEILEAVGGG